MEELKQALLALIDEAQNDIELATKAKSERWRSQAQGFRDGLETAFQTMFPDADTEELELEGNK